MPAMYSMESKRLLDRYATTQNSQTEHHGKIIETGITELAPLVEAAALRER
jgi:hypothetical protein